MHPTSCTRSFGWVPPECRTSSQCTGLPTWLIVPRDSANGTDSDRHANQANILVWRRLPKRIATENPLWWLRL